MEQANAATILKTMRLKHEVVSKVEDMARKENRNFTNMVETLLMKQLR